MSDIEPKTEAWSLESIQVNYKDELWSIRGGACQPEYNITAHTLEQAVSELVKQVTRDAIEDEAREWQNDNSVSVLDACCGSRMFWFDRTDDRVTFVDKRRESHILPDKSSAGGSRKLVIDPDIQADFTALPFADDTFSLVVFDPPHLVRNGKKGWLAKKYGKLEGDWKEELRQGFAECFRVLHPAGTLIFKWNEHEVPVSQVLALTPERPLLGNRCGKTAKSHWIVFSKPKAERSGPAAQDSAT